MARVSTKTKIRGYVALTKPRIIESLLITTVPAMVVAQRGWPSLTLIVATVVAGTLSAGSANAINMWYDRDIDKKMPRTSKRPLVTGVLKPNEALVFAVMLQVVSMVLFVTFVNLLSAVLALAAACYYVFVYTIWLKRISVQNIVIGGAAGAAPTLIGWAAVTGNLSLTALLMFALVFVWTPPHFWALACKYKSDYEAAHVPMLPVVKSRSSTANEMIVYTLVMIAISMSIGWAGNLGYVFFVATALANLVFLGFAIRFKQTETDKDAMRLFHWSITYLTIVFVSMAVDQVI